MVDRVADYYSQNAELYAEENRLSDLPDTFHDILKRFSGLVDGKKILDAGCGPGRDAHHFTKQGFDVTGVDIAEGAITYARENHAGTFEVMDIRSLNFEEDTFDGAWCCASIFFVPRQDQQQVLNELYRVLKPGGVVYVEFKTGDGVYVKDEYPDEVKQYLVPEDVAARMVNDAGFDLIEASTNTSREKEFANFFARKPEA